MACFYCAPFILGSRERAAFAHSIYWLAIAFKYPPDEHTQGITSAQNTTHTI